jgi:hypothetical protein
VSHCCSLATAVSHCCSLATAVSHCCSIHNAAVTAAFIAACHLWCVCTHLPLSLPVTARGVDS